MNSVLSHFWWIRVSSSGQFRGTWCTHAKKMECAILTKWHVTTVSPVAFGAVWRPGWKKKVN